MKLNSKYPINKLFDKYNFVDNQLIYTRKTDLGFLEVFYWRGFYEVYFRLHKKRYGYFITSLSTVRQAYNFLEASSEIDLTKYVTTEIFQATVGNLEELQQNQKTLHTQVKEIQEAITWGEIKINA